MNYKKIIIYLVIILFLFAFIYNTFFQKSVYDIDYPLKAKFDEETTDLSDFEIQDSEDFPLIEFDYGTTTYWDKKIYVEEDFTTELPLVIIDVGYDTIKQTSFWDSEKGYMVSTPGVDPNSYGIVSIVDNKDKVNKITDEAVLVSDSVINLRGNTSQGYDKKQYKVLLTDNEYVNKDMQVLDIGYGHEWVLNGAFSDSSMMRNYLAYQLAGGIVENTPDVRYAEVVIKTNLGYDYQGVYLLSESVERSNDRVDIEKYSNNSLNHATFIMKRDRYTEEGVILDNYSKINDLAYGYIEVLYPNNLEEKDVELLTNKLDNFEEALYSNDFNEYKKYRDLIDVDTFFDYFIINEVLMNYDAGFNSTYFYSDSTGKISMGPVWDFDLAFDNDRFIKGNFKATAFHEAPWFDRLLLDPWFTEGLIKRYHELRKSVLSDENFLDLVTATSDHLGSAIDREWDRWGYYYNANLYNLFEYESQFDAPDTSFDIEVDKVKVAYLEHAKWLDAEINSLYQFSDSDFDTSSDININWGDFFGYSFIAIWVVSVIILQRRMV